MAFWVIIFYHFSFVFRLLCFFATFSALFMFCWKISLTVKKSFKQWKHNFLSFHLCVMRLLDKRFWCFKLILEAFVYTAESLIKRDKGKNRSSCIALLFQQRKTKLFCYLYDDDFNFLDPIIFFAMRRKSFLFKYFCRIWVSHEFGNGA